MNEEIYFFRSIINYIDLNDFQDEQCQNILHSACKTNHFKLIKYFVKETNIDLNKKNDDGYTPLMIILKRNAHFSIKCSQMFLKQKRFDPYITDSNNKSYLQNIKHKTKQSFFEKALLKRKFEALNHDDYNDDCLLPINKKQKNE